MPKAKKEDGFEDSLARLEKIVGKLEGEDLPLEESLALFEEGVKLAEACGQRLDAAEKRVALLVKDRDKGMVMTDFQPQGPVED